MFGDKPEEATEPIVQLPKVFIPSLYISGLNMPECEQYLINKTRFTIGSGADNDCVIDYPSLGLSRNHCVIEYEDEEGYALTDQNSTNGTFVNGKRILSGVKTRIKGGDQIRLGISVFEVNEIA